MDKWNTVSHMYCLCIVLSLKFSIIIIILAMAYCADLDECLIHVSKFEY